MAEANIFSYLETHFSLASGETTPRIILQFLSKVFSISSAYYSNNPDQYRVRLDGYSEYPLIKIEHMIQAYTELQGDMLEIFKSTITHKEWRDMLDVFFHKKRRKTSFSFKAVQKLIGIESDDSAKEFLAYLCHLGVLRCNNPSERANERIYELPIILQHIWQ